MNDYQHILLAVDFSEHSDYVAEKAKSLANKYQSKLSIIHVLDNIPMPDTSYGTVIALNQDSGYELLEAEKNQLKALGKKLGVGIDQQCLVWGLPKQEIITFANEQQADLIVLGSHGRHGLALLLGSTVNAVLHHALCDVMAVRLPVL
jgi:universal stress protein A